MRSIAAGTLLIMMSCSGASQTPKQPAEPPAARQFSAWLAVFNRADRTELTAYYTKYLPRSPQQIDGELAFSQETGGFVLRKAEESTAQRFVAILQERESEQMARATMEVEAAEPYRVRKLEIGPIPTPPELAPPPMTEANALAALRAEIDRAVAKDSFSGAVVVAKHGVAIFAQAYGFADRENKVANTLDTRFRIGSMNKMFTAVAILQLVQAKQLALDTPVGKILTGYPNQSVATKVTIHHLLTHTGGTGDIFGPEFDAKRLELRTIDDYVKLYGARDLEFEPGSKWKYSNYGFMLLGAIIEKVTGQTYYDAVSKHVYGPAGMTLTSSPPEDAGASGRSIGYTREGPKAPWTSAASTLPYRGSSAGGGDSTVTDLLRFANALTSHKLLDAEHTALVTTGKVDTPGGDKYAYGFSDGAIRGVRCYGHGGGAPGMNGQLTICDSGYTVAVLANVDPPAAGKLARFIRTRLPTK